MTAIDWDEVHRKLADATTALDDAFSVSPDILAAKLRERAKVLARTEEPQREGARIDVIVFQLAWEDFAVETRLVREVYPLKDLTPIPCTPQFLLGVINLRGELCPVVDLKSLLGLPKRDLTNATRAVIVHDETMELGIVADVIVGVRSIDGAALQAVPATLSGVNASFVRGVSPDRIVLLDAVKILAHPGIIINDQVDN